jgi:hypothetical protein
MILVLCVTINIRKQHKTIWMCHGKKFGGVKILNVNIMYVQVVMESALDIKHLRIWDKEINTRIQIIMMKKKSQ